jgi:hypothetical protein
VLKKSHIIISLFLIAMTGKSQSIKKNLLQANSLFYKQAVYVYGYEEQKNSLLFKCFSYTYNLQVKDSIEFSLGKHTPADFLEISVDTLHEVINFYFQLSNQKNVVTLLRLIKQLGKVCSTENYDANHINSLKAFDDETYNFKEDLYLIKTNQTDTAGNQFFLSKYHVQSMIKPFEYDFKWQFAFEKKYIHRASVIYADSSYVMIYAHVFDGIKKGQWILRINANTGELIKGTKLNTKGDDRLFLLSNTIYNKGTNGIDVIGSIYTPEMIDFKDKKSNFVNLSKQNKLFLVCINNNGEITSRAEKLFALPIQTNTGKLLMSYHVKIREFKKINATDFDVWADLYERSDVNTFVYYSSWHIDIKPDDVDYAITPSRFYVSTKVIPKMISTEKGNTYGKFIMNDIGDYDKFKYKNLLNSVVIKTDNDDMQNPYFILKKVTLSNATKNYYYTFVGKKGLENKEFIKSEQGQKVNLYFMKGLKYLSFITNPANSEFELKLNSL